MIADDQEIVVIGSQAILATAADAPSPMLVSVEADVYPRNHPDRADLIDGSIGELSPFHQTFGYYAHGVHPTVAALPEGWQNRLVKLDQGTSDVIGWCLDPDDLALSKLVAGREKDLEFVRVGMDAGLIDPSALVDRLPHMTLFEPVREAVRGRIERLAPHR